jgi:Clp amino terminal domain, pathogenicity island component
MFERFHPDARAAIAHARHVASRSGHREIGTEHLLLGLLARPGHAADALTAAGADAADLRARIPGGDAAVQPELLEPDLLEPDPLGGDALAPAGTGPDSARRASDAGLAADSADGVRTRQHGRPDGSDEMPMTSDAKRALELALHAAQRLRHQHVSSGHILLGIIDQPGTPAVQTLRVAGIHVGMLRADVLRRMAVGPEAG